MGSWTEQDIFNNLSAKFSNLMYGRTKGDSNQLNKLLDELNNLDYRYPLVNNPTKAILLIHQCCTLISPDDPDLVLKCCKLIIDLVNRQHITFEGQTLLLAIQWCLQVVKQAVNLDVLLALEALLKNNFQSTRLFVPYVLNQDSPLIALAKSEKSPENLLLIVQCLEACTYVSEDALKEKTNHNLSSELQLCVQIFVKHLTTNKPDNFDDILHCKVLRACLQGLQNIIRQDQDFLLKEVGLFMGISKSYMVYGIKGIEFVVPQKVLPSILNVAEPASSSSKEKKGGKVVKQKKHRAPNLKKDSRKSTDAEEWVATGSFKGYIPATGTFDVSYETTGCQAQSRLKTSDSDFSDTEAGRVAKLGIMQGRVRQAALGHLLYLIKLLDKHTMFCYWSSLIPDGSLTGTHNLVTCILKDTSPKGRMASLNVLLVILSNSKLYLSQAESSHKYSAFTPFSVILGATLKDLHRCLSLALNENSIPVLIQVLKCVAALVQATPYHRLTPGILTKIIRNVKAYIRHKDATVQVAALIVFGCILASEPLVPETKEVLLKNSNQSTRTRPGKYDSAQLRGDADKKLENDIEFAEFSSEDEECVQDVDCDGAPWLLEWCLNNLGVSLVKDKLIETSVPTPVKLESLQVISAMTRNYFDCLMKPYLSHITKGLNLCLSEKYTDLRLHAGRTLDFIGQAISQHINLLDSAQDTTMQKSLLFWQALLNNLSSLFQSDQHVLRAVACDCFGGIGPRVFEHLPRDKQILIITLLFGCSRDEENSVKAAAVRALAICVLYPSLREDPGFVVDVAETIHRSLQDENMMVRIKSSWSLGNLSDALVVNASDKNMDEIPKSLLLKLVEITIKVSSDNDKIKVNAVRALGNLLQLITPELIAQKQTKDVSNKAIDVLIKNASTGTNMKIRWNACYAIGNALKNSVLFTENENGKTGLFSTLMDLVMGFKNFKVRINAALALSCPVNREAYGQHFYVVWNSLVMALENTQNIEDFSEYNHRDHLVEQICLTLGHLATLIAVQDLRYLHDNLNFHLDTLKLQTHRVLERVVPEKSSVLLDAVSSLNNLLSADLTGDQRRTVEILLEIFNNDV